MLVGDWLYRGRFRELFRYVLRPAREGACEGGECLCYYRLRLLR
jgi:hypothetical protein